MGAINRDFVLETTNISETIGAMVRRDEETYWREEDMYEGHLNGTGFGGKVSKVFKGTTEKQIQKNISLAEEYLEENSAPKYKWQVVEVGQKGYYLYDVKYESLAQTSNKAIHVISDSGKYMGEFKSITEMKKALKGKDFSGKAFVYSKQMEKCIIGRFIQDGRLYKTKPKSMPKKYRFCKEMKVYVCTVLCSY